jgi:hypothetical protein
MHCADRLDTTVGGQLNGQIACYVKNFGAGDDFSEFTFGMSSSIAFANMAVDRPFATVAMVYRSLAGATNRVFFVVYDADGNLSDFAALDRYGVHFAVNGEPGTPGVNFNNHIPSNCMNCHGGNYAPGNHSVTGALFLPFDLDQFDYEDVAGRTRHDQEPAFKKLNEIARKVAALSGGRGGVSIRDQLDGWYANSVRQGARTEIFENEFDSTFVPAGWSHSAEAHDVYTSVVRPFCRNCHMAFNDTYLDRSMTFSAEAESFRELLPISIIRLCDYRMPHALQTTREFWTSAAPLALDAYTRSVLGVGLESFQTARNCGQGTVVTLDPHLIASSTTL